MVSLKGWLPTKSDFAIAAGAALSGTVTGLVGGFIPINLEYLPGMTEFLIGTGVGKFLLKKGMGRDFAKGIQLSGLSRMIESFTAGFGLGGSFPTTREARPHLQQNGYPHSQWFGPRRSPALYQDRSHLTVEAERLTPMAGKRTLNQKRLSYIKVR